MKKTRHKEQQIVLIQYNNCLKTGQFFVPLNSSYIQGYGH